MCTSIILTLAVGLTATLVSGQGQSWPSGQFPSAGFSQYQPYRGPSAQSAPPSIPSTGQYQSSPQLATLSQLSGYSRLASPAQALQSGAWNPNQPGNRGWSIPAPTRSFASAPQPQSAGYSTYARPATLTAPASAPAQFQGTPFQNSYSIQHQSASPQQLASASLPAAPQLQNYRIPSPVAAPPVQSWSPPSAPAQTWRAPAPAPQWTPAPAAPAPVQTWRAPAPAAQWTPSPAAPAPAQTWRAPAQAPVQSWSAPAPAPQWRPAPAPAQTYTAPQPAPAQAAPRPAPQPASTYQSQQNAQNLRPAPVHYASIGPQLQGDYKFGYHTGDGGSFREETRLPDGTVQGAYGFIDADGKQRVVRYRAGKEGFQAEGDDVPKGSPVAAGEQSAGQGQGQSQPQPAAAPIQVEEGAAFRSFSQG